LLTKRRRRSGVSSVIGAIFFILVVFLVFSATVLVFQSFSSYSNVVKQVNAQDDQNKVTDAGVSDLAFGGLATNSVSETLDATQNNIAPTRALLPIANMNFSNNMNGWVFSREYKIVRDNGYVTNTFLNVLPGGTVFTLSVTNDDPLTESCPITSCIVRVSVEVDASFGVAGLPELAPPVGWNAPVVSGNTITWNSAAPGTGISPGAAPVLFNYTTLAPAIPGAYYQTATLTWATIFHGVPIEDEGSVSLETQVVTGGPGGVSCAPNDTEVCPPIGLCPAPATWNICAEPSGVVPGGAIGGFDGVTGVGSTSGPGSVFIDFEPTYNGTTIVQGQQLTAVMNFTSVFTLDPGQVGALAAGSVDAINFGYSLDQVTALPEPLILMTQYLVQLSPTGATLNTIEIPNAAPIVPTGVNAFNSSGWITCGPSSTVCTEPSFNPVALATAQDDPVPWTWLPTPDEYQLVISVTISMSGASPPSVFYPASMLMHFDDIGLSLQDNLNAWFVDNSVASLGCTPPAAPTCLLEIPFPSVLAPSQLQSIRLTTTISLAQVSTQNITAYIFVGDVSRGTSTPVWVEVGQLELSSSATITVNIPATTASNFIDTSGDHCGNPHTTEMCVRVYAISDGNNGFFYDFGSLTATATATLQTFIYNTVTLTLFNNSTAPVGFTNVYISGPDGVSSYNLTPACTAASLVTPGSVTPCYVNQGQELVLSALPFVWKADQTYVATVITNKGLSFSETFVSP
jgi:hypothetical protein